ncbi:hypothetical protein ES332_D07G237900v1 [Gossypium tomentosum]|uniref:Uncharacterized protein n=1 Tax=Gossypium tomentosum TaxID=34277 RepID=A0A5D2KAU0_GOSTO|nr:hypothetical protein ES332_D07G237900v1 [Gossypium tomentosum]
MPSGTGDPEASTPSDKEPLNNVREIHQKALDDLVNVNSLFTLAVFVGLSMARQGERSLENRTECDADVGNARRLVVNEVVSFACFLLSSLVAKALKIHVTICQEEDFKDTRNQDCEILNADAVGVGVGFRMHIPYGIHGGCDPNQGGKAFL